MDLTLQQLVLRLIAYVFIAAVHGFAVALVAATGVITNVLGPPYRTLANSLLH